MSQCNAGAAASLGLLAVRLCAGLSLLLLHGLEKLQNFSEMKESFPDPAGVGSEVSLMISLAAEVFATAMLVVGIGTRIAAFGLAVVMGVAVFKFHAGDAWEVREKALLYFGVFVMLMGTGAGRYSLDAVTRRKKK